MLCVGDRVSKHLIIILLVSALGRFRERARSRGPGLGGQGRERAPGVEFSAGPVGVGGAEVEAAEDFVGEIGAWPLWEGGGARGGELAVADVFLVFEGVVFAD